MCLCVDVFQCVFPQGKSLAGDVNDKLLLKKALRGVRTVICPNVRMYISFVSDFVKRLISQLPFELRESFYCAGRFSV